MRRERKAQERNIKTMNMNNLESVCSSLTLLFPSTDALGVIWL
jgi:hypothetical protein